MKVLSAEFIRSCHGADQFPADRLHEIGFAGRSNVGKSSLINSLLNRKKLVKVSRTPGKTQAINFFRVAADSKARVDFYLVDLPGYGYAKVAKAIRRAWAPLIEGYLTCRPELRGLVLLVDSRGPHSQDRATVEWIQSIGHRTVIVATKIDKLSWSQRTEAIRTIRATLRLSNDAGIIAYSSTTHEGRDDLWRALTGLLA